VNYIWRQNHSNSSILISFAAPCHLPFSCYSRLDSLVAWASLLFLTIPNLSVSALVLAACDRFPFSVDKTVDVPNVTIFFIPCDGEIVPGIRVIGSKLGFALAVAVLGELVLVIGLIMFI
jgi:hypothetical protein